MGDDRLGDWSGWSLLDGGDGDDVLRAGAGQDTLIGGAGNDHLTGGKHADTFVFDEDDGEDVIADFSYAEDVISLSDVEFGSEDGQVDQADFLSDVATIDGKDLQLDLGDGRSIKILNIIDEENIGDEVEDCAGIFELA